MASILVHHTTRAEATQIARELRDTYNVTRQMCYGYVATVVERIAGMDASDQREVRETIERVCTPEEK